MPSVVYAECHKLALFAKCRYGECHYGECRGAIKKPVEMNEDCGCLF